MSKNHGVHCDARFGHQSSASPRMASRSLPCREDLYICDKQFRDCHRISVKIRRTRSSLQAKRKKDIHAIVCAPLLESDFYHANGE
jgi:hypothetical protein